MLHLRTLGCGAVAIAAALMMAFAAPCVARDGDIVEEWDAVKPPPRPELKAVTLNGSTTALLILDLTKRGGCGTRPRCAASVPSVKRLQDAARAAGAMLWYTMGDPADAIDPAIQPHDGEYQGLQGPDKFLGSNLEEKLKARGIKTVIVCGSSFQGVGIGTGSAAATRGYDVIVPVDCLSSEDLYDEQYSAWHMFKGGPNAVTRKVTMTRTTMVKFAN
jgi:isochorismatase family protein